MPNIKSAKKRVLVIEKKTMRNKAVKSALKTQVTKKKLPSFSPQPFPLSTAQLRRALFIKTTRTIERLSLLRNLLR